MINKKEIEIIKDEKDNEKVDLRNKEKIKNNHEMNFESNEEKEDVIDFENISANCIRKCENLLFGIQNTGENIEIPEFLLLKKKF